MGFLFWQSNEGTSLENTEPQEKKPKKICCACPETKVLLLPNTTTSDRPFGQQEKRDLCIAEKGSTDNDASMKEERCICLIYVCR